MDTPQSAPPVDKLRPPSRTLSWRRLANPATVTALVFLSIHAVFTALVSLTTGWLTAEPVARNMAWLAVAVLTGAFSAYVGRVIWNGVVNRAEGRLRMDLLSAALAQPVRVLGEQSSGEILDRVDDDTQAVGRMFRFSVWPALRICASIPPLWIVAGLTWWPGWIAFPVLLALIVALARPQMGEIARRRVREEEAWTAHATVLEESISARDDLRTSLGQPLAVRRLAELSANIHRRLLDVLRAEIKLLASTDLPLYTLLAVALVTGALLTAAGSMTVSALVTLFLVTTLLVGVMGELISNLPQIQEGVGALTRIKQLLDAEAEPTDGAAVPDQPLALEVRGLNFEFDDGQGSFALRDISLTVPAGQTVALVGRTGSGKSTLASMLSRAVEPPAGSLFVGGRDICDLNLESLRRAVGVVTQRTELIAATLRDNITLFENVKTGAVEAAITELGLTEWVAGLPDGLDTELGSNGTSLSAGEEQLVSFARLLVRDVQVVVLDEATARMDPLTEALVVAAADRLLRGRTGVLVAHRLTTIERADLVAVLDHGRLSQFGRRTDLAEQSGQYRDLLTAATGSVSAETVIDLPSSSVDGTTLPAAADEEAFGHETFHPDIAVMEASAGAEGPHLAGPHSTGADTGADAGAGVGSLTTLSSTRRKGTLPQRRGLHRGMGVMRSVARQFNIHKAWGLLGGLSFTASGIIGAFGPLAGYMWGRTVAGVEAGTSIAWPLTWLIVGLFASRLCVFYGIWVYPRWWIQLSLRTRLAVMRGQTDQRRLPATPPGEVVARAMDSDRFITYGDRWIDFMGGFLTVAVTSLLGGSLLAGAVLAAILLTSVLVAIAGRPVAGRSAKAAADARALFGRVLVSAVGASRTIKLSARTGQVHAFLSEVDGRRVKAQVFEHRVAQLLNGLPWLTCQAAFLGSWVAFYYGWWSLPVTLLVSTTAAGFDFIGFVAGQVVTAYPGTKSWKDATDAFVDGADLLALPDGVDLVRGVAPAPLPATELPAFESLSLDGVTVMHEDDGTIGVSDFHLRVERGELVLLLGRVGSGKSSLLAALAGLMPFTGEIRWNGEEVLEAETFLRPGRVAYVQQVPRLLSGSIAENITLAYPDRAVEGPVADAQLQVDIAESGGLEAAVGHKGVRLSGGQLQRLALARALATGSQVLIADDVSSALDAKTELGLWDALRSRGMTVIGSTSKAAALAKADRVVVMAGGEVVATGPWADLAASWGHLAG
ncbi:MAG: ABC transporter ATP-binding protein/permease [Promicromonosporaceae bacterium]|nr:ABC transporter ATP-binding protein/permease [Promicromonosporaceae bacterium]